MNETGAMPKLLRSAIVFPNKRFRNRQDPRCGRGSLQVILVAGQDDIRNTAGRGRREDNCRRIRWRFLMRKEPPPPLRIWKQRTKTKPSPPRTNHPPAKDNTACS
ncbi:hypothetical protein JTE90_003008 [Oedothorax gibbosus]|uniref:Uncharacterized protein n=1 Tax=Oedothorax gibbosus TaxID=931172 RepID=A0AAV6VBS8_9ARAC|nr:hypothetical protein JTE90_003008 [Oedothorax gibbosus]